MNHRVSTRAGGSVLAILAGHDLGIAPYQASYAAIAPRMPAKTVRLTSM